MSSFVTLQEETHHYGIVNQIQKVEQLEDELACATSWLQKIWLAIQVKWERHLLNNSL